MGKIVISTEYPLVSEVVGHDEEGGMVLVRHVEGDVIAAHRLTFRAATKQERLEYDGCVLAAFLERSRLSRQFA